MNDLYQLSETFFGHWPLFFPLFFLAISSLLVLLMSTWRKGYSPAFWSTLVTLIMATIMLWILGPQNVVVGDGMVVFDHLSFFSTITLLCGGILVTLNLKGNDRKFKLFPEIYALLLFTLIGMMVLVGSLHLIVIFIALEIMTLAVYVMVAMRRTSKISSEAGLKYFIMGGVAACFFLYGSSLLFGHYKTFNILLMMSSHPQSPLVLLGSILILCSLLFKIGAFPFHSWVPDIYEGAMISVTGMMASLVKMASFILLVRLSPLFFIHKEYFWLMAVCAVITLFYGSLVALFQQKVKRLLAYSSIAHTGYLLLGVLAYEHVSVLGYQAILFYLFCYIWATLGVFSSLSFFDDHVTIASLRGWGLHHPYLGVCFSLFLLSLAGLPLTGGLLAKYYLFWSVLENTGQMAFLIVAVISSLISLYYYLRIIMSLFTPIIQTEQHYWEFLPLYGTYCVIFVASVLTILLGILPTPIFMLLKQ